MRKRRLVVGASRPAVQPVVTWQSTYTKGVDSEGYALHYMFPTNGTVKNIMVRIMSQSKPADYVLMLGNDEDKSEHRQTLAAGLNFIKTEAKVLAGDVLSLKLEGQATVEHIMLGFEMEVDGKRS